MVLSVAQLIAHCPLPPAARRHGDDACRRAGRNQACASVSRVYTGKRLTQRMAAACLMRFCLPLLPVAGPAAHAGQAWLSALMLLSTRPNAGVTRCANRPARGVLPRPGPRAPQEGGARQAQATAAADAAKCAHLCPPRKSDAMLAGIWAVGRVGAGAAACASNTCALQRVGLAVMCKTACCCGICSGRGYRHLVPQRSPLP